MIRHGSLFGQILGVFNRNIFTKDSVRTMSNYVTDTVLKRQMDKIEMQDFIKFLGKNKTANWNLHKAKYGDGILHLTLLKLEGEETNRKDIFVN